MFRTDGLATARWKIQFLKDASEDIVFRNSARVAFLDGGSQRREFRFVDSLVAF
jgi:hypothetical protein